MIDVLKVEDMENEQSSKSDDIEKLQIKSRLLDQVALSNAFFKSQQRGDADLTFEEKKKIAADVLERNIPLFLQRFGKYVTSDDLIYFDSYRENYDVNFYLTELSKYFDKNKRKTKTKNRRYKALKQLISEGNYFSLKEMKKRNPLLFDQMIGRYMSEKEREELEKVSCLDDIKFSTFLLEHIDSMECNQLKRNQEDEEDAAYEEGDSDDDDGDMHDDMACSSLSESETQMLKTEFINIMYENFLAGKDHDFDYSTVDDNADYDSLDMQQLDEEEKYFDSEEPE